MLSAFDNCCETRIQPRDRVIEIPCGQLFQLGLQLYSLLPFMSTRLRHRPLIEEEDASALKLGSGV